MNQQQLILVISFPTTALIFQFSNDNSLCRLCSKILNYSSMNLAKSKDSNIVINFLQFILNFITIQIDQVNKKLKNFLNI